MPPRIRTVAVTQWGAWGHDGRRWPAEAIPRRPILIAESSLPLSEPPILLSGSLDRTDLTADLRRPPLRAEHERRRLLVRVEQEHTRWSLFPLEALGLRQELWLVWPAGVEAVSTIPGIDETDPPRLVDPFVSEFQVAAEAAGATLLASWPPDGASNVPTSLAFAALQFDDLVQISSGGVALESANATASPTPCEGIGWNGGHCLQLAWEGDLPAQRSLLLRVGPEVSDRSGAPVGPARVQFTTGHTSGIWEVLALSCLEEELAIAGGCVLLDDQTLNFRLRASGPIRAFLRTSRATRHQVAPRGEVSLRLEGLDAEPTSVAVELIGLSGHGQHARFDVDPPDDLAPLTITAVRSDPRGNEPQQEYVEVYNFGSTEIPLQGMRITDRTDRDGDTVTQRVAVPGNASVLLVPAHFDAETPDDVSPPPGLRLVRLDNSIASGGLSNRGEPLFLYDERGRRISSVPRLASPGAGMCWRRRDPRQRSGGPEDFVAQECQPGRVLP